MSLFEQKYELLEQIFKITKEANGFLSDPLFDDYEKIDRMYVDRQKLMEQVDEIDRAIKEQGISLDDDKELKSSFEILITGIAGLDEKNNDLVEKAFSELAGSIKEIKEGRRGLDMTKYSDLQGLSFDISQ